MRLSTAMSRLAPVFVRAMDQISDLATNVVVDEINQPQFDNHRPVSLNSIEENMGFFPQVNKPIKSIASILES